MRQLCLTPIALALLGLSPLAAQQAKSGDTTEQDLLELLNTPVVTASKSAEKLSDAPATVIVITRKDLEARGYREMTEIFQDLPGFDVTQFYGDTYFKPYARGFRNTIGEPFVVMLDGMVWNHLWYNNVEDFVAPVPLSNIDRIEVVYGPASALYGANAFNGVINVITRKDAEANGSSGSVKAWAGSFDNKVVDATYMFKRGDFRVSLSFRADEGDLDSKASDRYEWLSEKYLRNRTIYGRMLDYNTDVTGKLSSPIRTQAVDARLYFGHYEAGFTFLNLRTGYGMVYTLDGYQPGLSRWSRPQYSGYIRHQVDMSPTLSVTTAGRWRRDEVGPDSQDNEIYWGAKDLSSPNNTQAFYYNPLRWRVAVASTSLNQDWNWNPTAAWSVNAGLVLESQSQQTKYVLADGGYILTSNYDPNYMPNPASTSFSDLNHVYIQRHGVYTQGRYRFGGNQSVIAGVRSDWSTTFGGARTLRGGYVGNFGGLGIKALYGQGYNEPSWRLLGGGWAKSGSNPGLKPERSNTAEVSVSYTQSKWSVSGDLYQVKSRNVVVNLPANQGGAQNAGVYDLLGLDLHGQLLLPVFKEFKLWATVTHNFKEEMSPFVNSLSHMDNYANLPGAQKTALATDKGSFDIGDIAKTKGYMGATAQFTEMVGATLMGRYVSERGTVATNPGNAQGTGKIDSFAVFDGVVTCKFGKGLALQARVRNLFDKQYYTPGNRGGSGGFSPGVDAQGNIITDGNGDYVGPRGDYNSVIPGFSRNYDLSVRWQF